MWSLMYLMAPPVFGINKTSNFHLTSALLESQEPFIVPRSRFLVFHHLNMFGFLSGLTSMKVTKNIIQSLVTFQNHKAVF